MDTQKDKTKKVIDPLHQELEEIRNKLSEIDNQRLSIDKKLSVDSLSKLEREALQLKEREREVLLKIEERVADKMKSLAQGVALPKDK